jgi:hypothetical protein
MMTRKEAKESMCPLFRAVALSKCYVVTRKELDVVSAACHCAAEKCPRWVDDEWGMQPCAVHGDCAKLADDKSACQLCNSEERYGHCLG